MSLLNDFYISSKEKLSAIEIIKQDLNIKKDDFNSDVVKIALEIEKKFKFNKDNLSILLDNKIMNYFVIDEAFATQGKSSFLDFINETLKQKGLFLSDYNYDNKHFRPQALLNTSISQFGENENFLNEKELNLVFSVLSKSTINIYSHLSKNSPRFGHITKMDNGIRLLLKEKILSKHTQDFQIDNSNCGLAFIDFRKEKELLSFIRKL